MNTAPSGWLACSGQAVSRTTFAALFAAIGTTYGVGDGSTTFNLPDLRAEFIRGFDDGRGVDTGRVFGSAQTSQNLAHTHTGSTDSAGAHTHTFTYRSSFASGPQTLTTGSQLNNGTSFSETFQMNSAGAHTHTLTINSDGGTEARPRNIAMLYCIKT
jgi:microcystin-dependent protein